MSIVRKRINWEMTGKNLQFNRKHNMKLIRKICRELNYSEEDCNCTGTCESCTIDIDDYISCRELAQVLNVTSNIITNWESGLTPVPYEDLLMYQEICEIPLDELIVFYEQ